MEISCPPNKGLTESDIHFDFTKASGLGLHLNRKFAVEEVEVADQGRSISFLVDSELGTIGIVSSAFLQSDDKDELDWVRDISKLGLLVPSLHGRTGHERSSSQ
jgi:hypothetical protein